jgi:ADP-ribosylglycohydrolase
LLGAIAGDIIGSPYEFQNIDTKDFPLFVHASRYTDDSILTVALADCIMNNKDWIDTLHEYYERYENCGFGGMFIHWGKNKIREPYDSWGNGSAMRVSPVAYLYNENEAMIKARESAIVTHNHPEGIKGAHAITKAIILSKQGKSKNYIGTYMKCFYPKIPTIDETLIMYHNWKNHDPKMLYSCSGSVPQAIRCFLDSDSFEDTLRIAVSIGGDTDTIACMAGSIAEAFYGIPKEIEEKVLEHLDEHMLGIVNQFKERIK